MVSPKGGQVTQHGCHLSASRLWAVDGWTEVPPARERPSRGWAGASPQGSFTEGGSYSWAQCRDSGKGKQEGLDHGETRSRKKHSAKLGQKPFPSCVKSPERLGGRPEEAPRPWVPGSGRPGTLWSSSPCAGDRGESVGTNPAALTSSSPPEPPAMSRRQMALFKALSLGPSMRAAPEEAGVKRFTHDTWRIPPKPQPRQALYNRIGGRWHQFLTPR